MSSHYDNQCCIIYCQLNNVASHSGHNRCLTKLSELTAIELTSGPCLNIKTVFPRYGDSHDRLIFNMGIPILVRRHLYIETVPWLWWWKNLAITSVIQGVTKSCHLKATFIRHYMILFIFWLKNVLSFELFTKIASLCRKHHNMYQICYQIYQYCWQPILAIKNFHTQPDLVCDFWLVYSWCLELTTPCFVLCYGIQMSMIITSCKMLMCGNLP